MFLDSLVSHSLLQQGTRTMSNETMTDVNIATLTYVPRKSKDKTPDFYKRI